MFSGAGLSRAKIGNNEMPGSPPPLSLPPAPPFSPFSPRSLSLSSGIPRWPVISWRGSKPRLSSFSDANYVIFQIDERRPPVRRIDRVVGAGGAGGNTERDRRIDRVRAYTPVIADNLRNCGIVPLVVVDTRTCFPRRRIKTLGFAIASARQSSRFTRRHDICKTRGTH